MEDNIIMVLTNLAISITIFLLQFFFDDVILEIPLSILFFILFFISFIYITADEYDSNIEKIFAIISLLLVIAVGIVYGIMRITTAETFYLNSFQNIINLLFYFMSGGLIIHFIIFLVVLLNQ